MEPVLGIDLGTTNCCCAIYEYQEITMIKNEEGETLTPSFVYIKSIDNILVGTAAKNQRIIDSKNVVSSVKRFMGTEKIYNIDGKNYTPIDIASFILKSLKNDAQRYIKQDIKKAVITVPAYFNEVQRKATVKAGEMAGLDVIRIINEPTASCLAYELTKTENNLVLVYDFGGGTFDVSIVDITDGMFNVIAASGDNMLGGLDFDNKIVNRLLKVFSQQHGIDLSEDNFAMSKLYDAAEKAKILLSTEKVAKISIPFICANEKGPIHLEYTLERSEFEQMIEKYVDYTMDIVKKVISDSNLNPSDIDIVIPVGGSTKIPLIQLRLKNLFTEEKLSKTVDPDRVVAMGAAIQGAILSGDIDNVILVDITPLSLGVEVTGGLFIPVIDRNSKIPCENSKLFTTIADDQKVVEINIYQGERKLCSENYKLGTFSLHNIRQAKSGEPRIKVTFALDVNGILTVSAIDEDTKANQTITVNTSPNSLKLSDIHNIIKNAREFEREDLEFEEKIRLRSDIKHVKNRIIEKVNRLKYSLEIQNEIIELLKEIEENINIATYEQLKNYYDALLFYQDEIDYTEKEYLMKGLLG